jgi:ligand-binding SRPBCC domain-containing protein
MGHVQHSVVIEAPRAEVFQFLSDYKNRSLVLPKSDLEMELVSPNSPIKKGAEYEVKITRYGIHYPLTYIIEDCDQPSYFIERQISGVFEEWLHTFKFEEHSETSTLVTNIVDYSLPLGILGTLLDDLYVKADIKRILIRSHDNLQKHFAKDDD